MIEIKINGSSLTLPSDCKINIESKASWANLDSMGGDVVWSFNIPLKANAKVLDGASFIEVAALRQYDAEVFVDGFAIAKGELYVQELEEGKSLTCGMTINSFKPGWGNKKLSENEFGVSIEIGTSIDDYKNKWLEFLKGSLDEDSWYKFMLFVSESFMSENSDFGLYGRSENSKSYLESTANDSFEYRYVNRLFFDENNRIITRPDSDRQGLRIFNNSENAPHQNGYAFAPAIRLDFLLKQLFKSAGLRLGGSFISSDLIKKMFVQSLHSMDGTALQYPIKEEIYINWPGVSGHNVAPTYLDNTIKVKIGNVYKEGITISNSVISNNLKVTIKLMVPVEALQSRDYEEDDCLMDHYDEAYFLVMRKDSEDSLPNARISEEPYAEDYKKYQYGDYPTWNELSNLFPSGIGLNAHLGYGNLIMGEDGQWHRFLHAPAVAVMAQLTATKNVTTSSGNNTSEYYEGSLLFNMEMATGSLENTRWYFQLVRAKVKTSNEVKDFVQYYPTNCPTLLGLHYDILGVRLENLSEYMVIDTSKYEYCGTSLNVFSKDLDLDKHVPSCTNASFLASICKYFGVNLYVNATTGEAQMSFFKEIKNAQSIVIDNWTTSVKKSQYSPTRYVVKTSATRGGIEVNDAKNAGTFKTREDIPFPQTRKGMFVFIENENAWLQSTEESNTWTWRTAKGNEDKLKIGDYKEETSIESGVTIGNMVMVDQKGTSKYIAEINSSGVSELFQSEYDGEFPLIIVQYQGKREIDLQKSGEVQSAWIEVNNPTELDMEGNEVEGCYNLSETGKKSIGEIYQKPMYEMLAEGEDMEFNLAVKFADFAKIWQLNDPSLGAESSATRWISYKGQRYLPKQINYEIGNGPLILITIKAKRKYTRP